jgi:alanyl-tRNA synthetase
MRRIEALTGDAADAYLAERSDRLERAATLVGATSPEAIEERIATLLADLRETKRRLKAGGSELPRPGELAGRATEVSSGIRLVVHAGPYESIEALKGAAKEVRSALGSGVIALGLDAEEPQLFVTVSDDLVAQGISAGELVRLAIVAVDGRGGGRPEMAQGKGQRRDGLADALAAVERALRDGSPAR